MAVNEALERVVGSRVLRLDPVAGGYTHNLRSVATLADGRKVFVKQAVDGDTAEWLRTEHSMYEALVGASFMPKLVAWGDAEHPILVLEDLSVLHWPPPWTASQIDALLRALAGVAAAAPRPSLPRNSDAAKYQVGWLDVVSEPSAFLGLRLCSAAWLDRAAPVLIEAAAGAPLGGDRLVHNDVRSDNVCFDGQRAVIVDWNLAGVGNPDKDIAFWLPSLAVEGGPEPEEVAPTLAPGFAALVAGFFAARAGLPVIPRAPRVRDLQLEQLRAALPWAARVLGLPIPDGHI